MDNELRGMLERKIEIQETRLKEIMVEQVELNNRLNELDAERRGLHNNIDYDMKRLNNWQS